MQSLLLAVYIVVSTYYLIGILNTWERITKEDPVLRMFLMKCPSAKWFAGLLIFIAAYSWPVGILIRPLIKSWVAKNIQHPVDKEAFRKHVGL